MKLNFNALISALTPKNESFFLILSETAEILEKTAGLQIELFATNDETERVRISKAIKDEERKGDEQTGKIFNALNNTFITPIDREDISSLTDEMDDAIDSINRTAHKVQNYSPEDFPQSMRDMTHIIMQGTQEIKTAIADLHKLRKADSVISACTLRIKRLEEDADRVYEKGITELFHNDIKIVELIKLKEIIQELERSANIINTVGKVLKTIIVKYS